MAARVEAGVPRRDLAEEVGDESDRVRVGRIDGLDLETAFLDHVESSLYRSAPMLTTHRALAFLVLAVTWGAAVLAGLSYSAGASRAAS